MFVDSTDFSGFPTFCCGFHKLCYEFNKMDCFRSDFEQSNNLAICLRYPKQQIISMKKSKDEDSVASLLQFTTCKIWPRIFLLVATKSVSLLEISLLVKWKVIFSICSGLHYLLNLARMIQLYLFIVPFHELELWLSFFLSHYLTFPQASSFKSICLSCNFKLFNSQKNLRAPWSSDQILVV